jgi:hypothetical protein
MLGGRGIKKQRQRILQLDLPEALQLPERFATTGDVAESLSPSPMEVNKPILVEESDQEQVREDGRPRRNHQRSNWLYDFKP